MKNPMKILLVEDEPAILRGLRAVISKLPGKYEIAGTCYDGKSALEFLKAQPADLVITDIRMPVMDGLTMIEQARLLSCPAKFIILTGYAEFEYAKRAITLGVSDFLLKPFDSESLLPILEKLSSEKTADRKEKQKLCLEHLIFHNSMTDISENPFKNYNLTLVFSYYGAGINNIYSEFNLSSEIVRNLDLTFLSPLEQKYAVWIHGFPGKYYNEYIYAIAYSDNSSPVISAVIKELWEKVQTKETYVNFVISDASNDFSAIESAIQNNYLYTLFHLPYGCGKIQYTSKICDRRLCATPEIEAFSDSLNPPLTMHQLSELLNSILSCWKELDITQFQLSADIRWLLNRALAKNPAYKERLSDPGELIAVSDSYEELKEHLLLDLKKIYAISDDPGKKSNAKLLAKKVLEYLDANFTTAITYKLFYDIFGYNEKYITTLFKEEYGITPSKYVVDLRLKKAKELMQQNPDILLKDVAELVGYGDPLYFSRVFKSSEGISPRAYQKSL